MTKLSFSLPHWLVQKKFVLTLMATLAIIASAQSLLLGPKQYRQSDWIYPSYNNYTIFKQSFYHLTGHQDLYKLYPAEHWDLYKYTPTFSLLFGTMALLPDTPGLIIWNLLNILILAFAIYALPKLHEKQKSLILLACAIEAMTAMQNEQSNGLIAGLLVFAFVLCEQRRFFWAMGLIVLATFIKPFGIVGLALLIFYPQKIRTAFYTLSWFALLFALPLVIIPRAELWQQYQSWLHVLAEDQSYKYGYSVAGWLHTWFQVHPDKNLITGTGIVLFLLPLARFKMYTDFTFKLWVLSSILIWVVIFNHMAESPTFILAMTGASIWFFSKTPSKAELILFILVFAFVSLSPTDIVPHHIRKTIFRPYVLKAVPCIFLWLKISYDLLRLQKTAINSPSIST